MWLSTVWAAFSAKARASAVVLPRATATPSRRPGYASGFPKRKTRTPEVARATERPPNDGAQPDWEDRITCAAAGVVGSGPV